MTVANCKRMLIPHWLNVNDKKPITYQPVKHAVGTSRCKKMAASDTQSFYKIYSKFTFYDIFSKQIQGSESAQLKNSVV